MSSLQNVPQQDQLDQVMSDIIEDTDTEFQFQCNNLLQEKQQREDVFSQQIDQNYLPNKRMKLDQKINLIRQDQEYSELDLNTPMMQALMKQDQILKPDQTTSQYKYYQKSVLQKHTTIYWLGYLYKKIHQSQKEHLIKTENQNCQEQILNTFKYYLPKRLVQYAQQMKEQQIQKHKYQIQNNPQDEFQTLEEQKNRQIQERIIDELKHYKVENDIDEIETIGHIWNGQTAFFFDSKKSIEILNQLEDDNFSEKAPELLKQTWETKWEQFDSYWFQKHKYLGPKHKKQELNEKYKSQFQP